VVKSCSCKRPKEHIESKCEAPIVEKLYIVILSDRRLWAISGAEGYRGRPRYFDTREEAEHWASTEFVEGIDFCVFEVDAVVKSVSTHKSRGLWDSDDAYPNMD
jgi:hypothetical protein